jgi:tetratricopeptide (TPR) repeat protein
MLSGLSIILLSGCISSHYDTENEPKTVKGLLAKTDRLIKQQRWGEALNTLKQGIESHPNEQLLEEKQFAVNFKWTAVKRRLEDWILIYEVEGLLSQRPLLVSMSQSKPDDFFLKLRLSKVNSKLNARRNSLLRCSKYQLDKDIKLTRRCIESARRVEVTEEIKQLLNLLDIQLSTQQQDIANKNQDIKDKNQDITDKKELKNAKLVADNKAAFRASKIMLARSHIQARLYFEALVLLEPLLLEDKYDQKVTMLIDEAITGRDLQILQLISHGDKLYRKEKTIEAISIWQQASRLNPKDSSIKRRIERALKVIENLEEFSN